MRLCGIIPSYRKLTLLPRLLVNSSEPRRLRVVAAILLPTPLIRLNARLESSSRAFGYARS